MIRCTIWYHLFHLKHEKCTWRSVSFSKVAEACNFTKSNIPPWAFLTFLKLYKWYQIAQRITYSSLMMMPVLARLLICCLIQESIKRAPPCFTDFVGGFLSLIKLSAMCSPKYPFWRYFLRFDATRSITSLNNILGYGFLYPSTHFPPFASRLKNQNVFSRQIYPVFSLDFEGTIYVDSSAFLASNSSNFLWRIRSFMTFDILLDTFSFLGRLAETKSVHNVTTSKNNSELTTNNFCVRRTFSLILYFLKNFKTRKKGLLTKKADLNCISLYTRFFYKQLRILSRTRVA